MSEQEFSKIVATLKSNSPSVRIQAIKKLGQFQKPQVLDLLLDLAVNDIIDDVRYEARREFAKLTDRHDFRDPLLQRLKSADSIAKKVLIAEALEEYKDLQVVNSLIAAYEQHRNSISLRESVAEVWLNIDPNQAKAYFSKEKVNILVAEDERDIRDLIRFTLVFAGWSVLETPHGQSAYRFTRLCEPDLVLLDVRMPRMNGYEACKLIKADPVTKHIPVVFLSARGQENEIQQGLDAGAEEYLLKPFAPDQLTEAIKAVMRKLRLGVYGKSN